MHPVHHCYMKADPLAVQCTHPDRSDAHVTMCESRARACVCVCGGGGLGSAAWYAVSTEQRARAEQLAFAVGPGSTAR
jgi:hypothetical protein